MGVDGFWREVMPYVKVRENRVRLSQLQGSTVGVDTSSWMYEARIIREAVLCYSSSPQYEPTAILEIFKSRINCLLKWKIKIVFVFDGSRHSMKSVARFKRDEKKIKSLEFIKKFYDKGLKGEDISDEDRKKAFSVLKDLFLPDEKVIRLVLDLLRSDEYKDIIKVECAPFEAEWQLVELQNRGEIDAIICKDSDFVFLGAKKLFLDVNYFPTCSVYIRDRDLASGRFKLATKYSDDIIAAAPGFIGNDYVERKRGNGTVTSLETHLPGYSRSGINYLEGLEWSESDIERFVHSQHLYRHAPVTREGKLVPLYDLPANVSDEKWGEYIGFGRHPKLLLPINESQYAEASLFQNYTSFLSKGALEAFDPPVYSPEENRSVMQGTKLPSFARLNLKEQPLACLHDDVLIKCAASRGVVPGGMDRTTLETTVKDALENRGVLAPEEVPEQIDRWVVSEVLDMVEGEDWKDYYTTIPMLAAIDNVQVDFFYPLGDEHNRERALLLLKGGNLMVRESMAVRVCSEKKTRKLLVRCDCVPSQKTTVKSENLEAPKIQTGYTVFLCFEYDESLESSKWEAQPFPYSCCGCYDGRNFCSHLLALLLMCAQVQRQYQQGKTKDDFENYLPPAPHYAQGLPVLFENIVRFDSFARSAKQTERRDREGERAKLQRTEVSSTFVEYGPTHMDM